MKQSNLSPVNHLLSIWKNEPTISPNIVRWQDNPGQSARITGFPVDLDPRLRNVLINKGFQGLYEHQYQSWRIVREGKHVVIVTGTASGKTLCYNLPVLNNLIQEPVSRALYLFPTKALAQDQKEVLSGLVHDTWNMPESDVDYFTSQMPSVSVYDGDTPATHRSGIRNQVKLLLTNPDMLHLSILPHHTLWAEFFKNLHFVIVDELHVYRGVFGSHVANVIRRLKRIAKFYGANPQFILTSATIANPVELAEALVEEPVVVIDQDGSPHSKRHFLLYNPPIIQPEFGIRRSALAESSRLAGDLMDYGIQTILFARSRRAVELLLRQLQEQQPAHAQHIHGYRSGYLPQERRSIEFGLRQGDTLAVVATNALELGVDIGGMGAILLVGYPGTIASTRQQIGRAGRRDEDGLAIMVASPNPIDQYLMKHPEYLFDLSPEKALINPDNLLILLQHVRCAAFELPFHKEEQFEGVNAELLKGLLEFLEQSGELHSSNDRYYWLADQYPANNISLRSTSGSPFILHALISERWTIVGEVDRDSAMWMVHPQAIYLHEGESYQVQDLDFEQSIAQMVPVEVDYYTAPHRHVDIAKIQVLMDKENAGGQVFYGEILVTSQVTGYRKIQWQTQQTLGEYPLDLPTTQLRTTAYWMTISKATIEILQSQGRWKNGPNDYGPNWLLQKKLARMRDHFTCQVCGIMETDQAHHVHHRVPYKLYTNYEQANQLDNLITICPTCHRRAELVIRIRSGLSGLSYVLQQLAPLFLMCDVNDLGVYFDPQAPLGDKSPTVAIYDQVPAGIGLSEEVYQMHDSLMQRALELILTCECQDGCPSCVGPAGENGVGGKEETIALLRVLTGSSLEKQSQNGIAIR
jgi:DEAD/DEAH box helicase domain-containing protein